MKNAMILILPLLLLTACTTPEERAARQAAIDAQDHAECLKLGFQPNHPSYGDCRLRLKEMRVQERIANRPVYYPSVGIGYGYRHLHHHY